MLKVVTSKAENKRLDELENGQVFLVGSDSLYMVTDSELPENHLGEVINTAVYKQEDLVLCVHLESGGVVDFCENSEVTPVTLTATIE